MPQLTHQQARALVDTISAGLDEIRVAIIQLWEGQGWTALGYDSWESLCTAEFRGGLHLPRPERRELVADLSEEGMSTRAIAPALGVHPDTVANDRRVGNPTAAPITGLDGKTYRAIVQRRPQTRTTTTATITQIHTTPEASTTGSETREIPKPGPLPWMNVMLALGAAARDLDPIKRGALSTEIGARDLDVIRQRINDIRSTIDRLADHIEEL
jgi:transposase-like protein